MRSRCPKIVYDILIILMILLILGFAMNLIKDAKSNLNTDENANVENPEDTGIADDENNAGEKVCSYCHSLIPDDVLQCPYCDVNDSDEPIPNAVEDPFNGDVLDIELFIGIP